MHKRSDRGQIRDLAYGTRFLAITSFLQAYKENISLPPESHESPFYGTGPYFRAKFHKISYAKNQRRESNFIENYLVSMSGD